MRYAPAIRRAPSSAEAEARPGLLPPSGRPVEVSLGESPRRMLLLAALGIVLGGVGGAAAFVVVRLVGLVSNLALLHRVGYDLPDLDHYHPGLDLLLVAVGGAVVVVGLARWSPVIKGHGIPESIEAIALRESRIKPRTLVAKPLSAALAMGTGGPFGAEGPIIVTGGCIGSLLGQVIRVSAAERRILLATGAAAGMAGVFDTPLAAIVLAFELLLFERSLRALLPLLLATGTAAEIHTLVLGTHPLFEVLGPLSYSAHELPLLCVLGLASGALAILLEKGLFAVEAGFRRLPVPEMVHPLLGAVGFGVVGLLVPGSLSVGYWAISDAVNGRFLLGTAAALFVAKMVSWWIALGSNTSGGTLAPIFLVGATMGEMLGIGCAHLFPGLGVDPAAFAVLGMGATFAAAARAPLTGAVFAVEVTGAYHLVVPMLLAVGLAEVVAELGPTERLMTDKLARRGLRIEFDSEVDPLRALVASQLMEPVPAGVAAGTGARHAGAAGPSGPSGPAGPAGPVHPSGAVGRERPSVEDSSSLRDVLPIFVGESGCDEIVVTEDGSPVGMLSRHTVAEVLRRKLAESELQDPTLHLPTGALRRRFGTASRATRRALLARMRRRRGSATRRRRASPSRPPR